MIVEDEAFVALDLSESVEASGFAVAGVALSLSQGFELLDTTRPDIAILDINLGKETVWPLARVLKDLQVPMIFTSADLSHSELSCEFAEQTKLEKPAQTTKILSELNRLVLHAPV